MTAREFYDQHESDDCVVIMKDFAKLKVTEALKAASENATTTVEEIYAGSLGNEDGYLYDRVVVIDEKSILNAYPLTNIK